MSVKLSQWHENERLLLWVQRVPGRLALWAVASALLLWHGSNLTMLAALSAVMLHPAGRRLYLSFAAVGMLTSRFLELPDLPLSIAAPWPWLPVVLAAAAGTCLLYLAYILAQRYSSWPTVVQRHPVLAVHAGAWLAMSVSTLPWFGALSLVTYFTWRFSYLAASASRGKLAGTRFRDHLFYLMPVYGGTTTPYGKGLDFLSRHEATDAAAMARSQLAGIKLLLLAAVWIYALELLDMVIFGATAKLLAGWPTAWMGGWTLGWPRLKALVALGAYPAWPIGWATAYLELIRATLVLAVMGHVIVGCLRLLGFNVFRNTYKPLLAESVLEFWNRYYYYFKELLVDFFFYPSYLRLRGLSPAARMFAAVFAAAFLGNMYHHLLIQPEHLIHFDLARLWASWSPRLVYCFLLALGIWVSMLRQQKLRAAGGAVRYVVRLRRIAGVWTFFAIIQIWNVKHAGVSIGDCTAFFLSLFGV
ncbi:MAG TPA: hypothetical protein VI566_04500 [Xanthomonadales bacterium]|nr:hypothetical protein [Xanthomonadales bacterium]